jgi:hypothetical protein
MYNRGNRAEAGIIGGTPATKVHWQVQVCKKMDYLKHRLGTKGHLNSIPDTVELVEA